MATGDQHIGRRIGFGAGVESTAYTSVAPGGWMRWLDQGLQNKTNVIENESAMGTVDRVNDSAVTHKWAEGTVGGKVTDVFVGYLFTGFFGLPSTGAASGGIYPHTFTMNQSSIGKTLTFAVADTIQARRHSGGVVDTMELTAETGGWVQVTSALKARGGVNSTETIAILTTEKEFTSKNVIVKLAANTGALAGATALKARSVKINLERPSEPYVPLGTDTDVEFDRGVFEAKGELVIRYTDTQYEEDFIANTIKAMSVTITNGTSVLTFTGSKVRYRELETSRGEKDGVVTQTLQVVFESPSTTLTTLLNNPKTGYTS